MKTGSQIAPAGTQIILRIAVCAPLPGLFDYLPAPGLDPQALRRGVRLRVPFGRGSRIGFFWDTATTSEVSPANLRPVAELLDREPLLPPADLYLLQWAADYYRHPLGEVLLGTLPVRLRSEPGLRRRRRDAWKLTPAGRALEPGALRRCPRQAQVLECLRRHPAGAERAWLLTECGDCLPLLKRLEEKGWAVAFEIHGGRWDRGEDGPALNPGQIDAVGRISAALGRFGGFLLDGVTGSGKTEVYLKLIEQVLERNGQVLILVPEIGLTPQLQRRLLKRLQAPLALLHSAMAEGERERGWWQARDGEAAVVLGTRSAVFAPMPRLALILVDEEHDLSFKQQDGFRYSARDLAVRRAQQRGCPVVLGSATPSFETLRNAILGRYTHLRLTQRAGGASAPATDLIDVRAVRLQNGLSPLLIRMLQDNRAAGGQSLLFLNRRGYAPILTCHHCGWVAGCPSCDARLTLHQADALLWCHHCGYRHPAVAICPRCAKPDLRALGQGTQRMEDTLASLFGTDAVVRIDRDSTRRRGSLEQVLEQARQGRFAVLLGTQMLAKGHHFPNVTLVAVLDVDHGLYGADYRAAERMAQLIVQVAGRAGRAEKPGRVVIQTRHPDHPLLQSLIRHGYGRFAAAALEERHQARLPPFSAQALLRAEAPNPDAPETFLNACVGAAGAPVAGLEFWGPVPAPMERRAGRYRAHLLIQAQERPMLQAFLRQWTPLLYKLKTATKVRWSIDVDPQELI